MSTILTILILYILGVMFYTLVVRFSPTNKHGFNIEIIPIVIDGIKGMAIGFAVVGVLYFIVSQILTWVRCGI